MNRTSTLMQLWRIDCETFRRIGSSFELRDVTTKAHDAFVLRFCADHTLASDRAGSTITFFPGKPGGIC